MFGNSRKATATALEPSTELFNPIAIEKIAKDLRIEKVGREDGSKNLPPTSSSSLSSVEHRALDEINRIKKRGVDDYSRHHNAYQNRIDASRGAVERIEEKAGQLCNEMRSESKNQSNQVKAKLRAVKDRDIGEQVFKQRHCIVGPPRDAKPAVLMVLGLVFAMLVEVALGGIFFSEKSNTGLLGGISTAFMLTVVNVVFCLLCGFGSRYMNLSGVANKLLGVISCVGFLMMALGFNLLVAHFRDALDVLPWEQAAGAALDSLRSGVFSIDSFNAVIISLFGFLVSLVAFIEGRIWQDPYPGYNRVYDAVDTAYYDYADAFEEAHEELNSLYEEHRDGLNGEAANLRASIRDAASAQANQVTLALNLSEFLLSCEQALNSMLRLYRENNTKCRSAPNPAYFDEPFDLNTGVREVEPQLSKSQIEASIARVDDVAKQGIATILNAREEEIDTLPTTEEVLDSLHSISTELSGVGKQKSNPMKGRTS